MTEQNPQPAAPQPGPHPVWGPPVPPTPGGRSRRRTALLAAGALVVVAALGGGGYALFGTGDGKPLAAPAHTATPSPARAYGVTSGGTHYGDLGRMLLPATDSLGPGPDFEGYGNDTVLDAARAEKLVEEGDGASHLGASERKRADAALDAMHIKGAALRTYSSEDGDQEYVITLVQVGNKLAARSGPETFRKLAEGSDVLRKGPAVAGHPHAVCVMPKVSASSSGGEEGSDEGGGQGGDSMDWLDAMYCQATEGDLMVQVVVDGPAPLSEDDAADVVADQLDRIQAPGEGV